MVDCLLTQSLVGQSIEIAKAISSAATVEMHSIGETFITQNAATNEIYFLLVGSVSIEIDGRRKASRSAGQHVGEMSAIDARALRSASAKALSDTVVATIAEVEFSKIAAEFPDVRRRLAMEMADRVRQRGGDVSIKNEIPRILFYPGKTFRK